MSVKSRPQKRCIGYARISTLQQDLTRQIQALRLERCDKIFSHTASGEHGRQARAGRSPGSIGTRWRTGTGGMGPGHTIDVRRDGHHQNRHLGPRDHSRA